MTGYSTVTDASASRSASGGIMVLQRRGRSPKMGGGQASMISSNINLLNTIIGAGTLAMPSAMSHFGVTLGVILIVWCGLTSAFGLYLQARCARYTDRGSSSFFALSQMTYPNAAVVFDAAIAVKCFGVGVSYMIIIGDLMPAVASAFGADSTGLAFLADRKFWITAFFLLFIIPLSFPKRLDSLKYTSVVALVSIGYLVILVVYHFTVDSRDQRGDVHLITWEGPVAALSSLPVVIFAYTCHQNMFSILNEIKDNSPASIVAVIGGSIGSAASVYILVAITGYLTFGDNVQGNIVGMYPASIASTIAKAAIVILVTFSIPLQVHPCRASIDAVLRWRPGKNRPANLGIPSAASTAGTQPLLLPSSASSGSSATAGGGATLTTLDSHGAPVVAMSELRFALITSGILMLSYLTALNVSSLDRVLAYVGSTGSTAISFILPGLFYYKISDPDSIHHQRLSKEDDDADYSADDDENVATAEDEVGEGSGGGLMEASIGSLRSVVSGRWRTGRRKWRWDLEHLEHGFLRKMALALAVYGCCVMVICLGMNMFFKAAH
ncbi:transmembrane amino acid transporter protein-domain-containing protein [Apodospora peruviana]|uniref:Transmembrane amino acid transporter protein-domain-containing protein n=1 Tax=Apodospora peruviana TaxID=516989 RepID=A0AAE0IUD0_9PEZI|nr:transmembrane amino acid transporter protein-domain-containing protein [Apodospora peruviana]